MGRIALALIMLSLGACSSDRWTLTVYNNHGTDAVVFRVSTAGAVNAWLLQAQQIEVVIRANGRPNGKVEILDPETCDLLAASDLPAGPAALATADRGVTGEGKWQLSVSGDDGAEAAPFPPTSGLCE